MERRIETTISRTAKMTTLSRAASFFEKKTHYKSDDYIATNFIPKLMIPFLRFRLTRNMLTKKIAPKGIYEYVISRTKYIDEIFLKAIDERFHQILIFGAGFDSRGIRLLPAESNITIFELDSPHTQKAKIDQIEKKQKISLSNNIRFISIDFNKESVDEKLQEAGFRKDKKSLFILEGLIMYLDENAVESTFKLIKKYAGKDSLLVFDTIYASVLREEHLYYGEAEIYSTVKNADEKWTFGIEAGSFHTFLDKRGFHLLELLDTKSLELKYFTDEFGKQLGKINGTHCILLAKTK